MSNNESIPQNPDDRNIAAMLEGLFTACCLIDDCGEIPETFASTVQPAEQEGVQLLKLYVWSTKTVIEVFKPDASIIETTGASIVGEDAGDRAIECTVFLEDMLGRPVFKIKSEDGDIPQPSYRVGIEVFADALIMFWRSGQLSEDGEEIPIVVSGLDNPGTSSFIGKLLISRMPFDDIAAFSDAQLLKQLGGTNNDAQASD